MAQSSLFNYTDKEKSKNLTLPKPAVKSGGILTQLNCGVCGAKLFDIGIDRGCQVLVCSKKCGQEYRIPTDVPPTKTYTCRQCTSPISEEQAQKTFAERGRALCEGCAGG